MTVASYKKVFEQVNVATLCFTLLSFFSLIFIYFLMKYSEAMQRCQCSQIYCITVDRFHYECISQITFCGKVNFTINMTPTTPPKIKPGHTYKSIQFNSSHREGNREGEIEKKKRGDLEIYTYKLILFVLKWNILIILSNHLFVNLGIPSDAIQIHVLLNACDVISDSIDFITPSCKFY